MSLQLSCDGIPRGANAPHTCPKTTDSERPGHGWITAIEHLPTGLTKERHFCSWVCLGSKAYCLQSSDNCK